MPEWLGRCLALDARFIISSMVIMFLMLILHLPGGSLKDRSWYAVLGLLCGPLMLIAQLYKP